MVPMSSQDSRRSVRAAMVNGCAIAAVLGLVGASNAAMASDQSPSPSPAADLASAAPPSPTATPASSSAAAPAPKTERRFDIRWYLVEGNTVLDNRAIERAVYPYLGPERTMGDIESARGALEKAYASAGYQTVYVTIPKQTVKDGIVRLKAVEAKVGELRIKSGNWVSDETVSAAVPSLKPGAVPNLNDVNRQMTALNSRSNDLQVTPQMKQGKAPGTIDVDLEVKDKLAVHGGLEINNRYSRDTHQYRLQANASYDNLWGQNHSLSGLYNVAPEDPADGEVYALTYTAPVPGSDVKLSLTGLRSNSNVATVGGTGVLGKGWSATLAAVAPLGTLSLFDDGDYFHYLQVSASYKRFTNIISLGTDSDTAPITYYPVSVSYNGSWHDTLDQIAFGLSANFAFRHLGSDQSGFDYTRYKADGNFFYLRSNGSWLRNLPWGVDLYLSGTAQFANGPLISNEQFSVGGDGSVRGYLQSEGLGDKGIQGTLEVRGPNLGPYAGDWFNELRFVTFFDGARTWLNSPLDDQQKVYSLRSTGVGVTAEFFDHLHASIYNAWSLHYAGSSGVTHYGKQRIQFRVWTEF
jgi:hemolysin activation/secretion protein